MQTIWIARHGDREDFADPRWHLTAERPDDPGLSADGIVQASDLGRRLQSENISHIYASPFLRTVQTAHIVAEALQLTVKIETGLTEYMCPDYFCAMPVLLAPASLKDRFPRLDLSYGAKVPFAYPEYGMEAAERAGRAARMLADAHAGENLLLVGHGASVIWATQGLMGRGAGSLVRPWLCCLVKLVRQPALKPPAPSTPPLADASAVATPGSDFRDGGNGGAVAFGDGAPVPAKERGWSECGCWCMELAGDVSHLSVRGNEVFTEATSDDDDDGSEGEGDDDDGDDDDDDDGDGGELGQAALHHGRDGDAWEHSDGFGAGSQLERVCRRGARKHTDGSSSPGARHGGYGGEWGTGGSGADAGDNERWVHAGGMSQVAGAQAAQNGNDGSRGRPHGSTQPCPHARVIMCIQCNGNNGGVYCNGALVRVGSSSEDASESDGSSSDGDDDNDRDEVDDSSEEEEDDRWGEPGKVGLHAHEGRRVWV